MGVFSAFQAFPAFRAFAASNGLNRNHKNIPFLSLLLSIEIDRFWQLLLSIDLLPLCICPQACKI